MKNIQTDKIFYNLAFSLLLGMGVIFCLSFGGFIFKLSINPFYLIAGILSVLGSVFVLGKKDGFNTNDYILSYLVLFVFSFVFYFLSGTFGDYSYDGREYHQNGIMLLKYGYNPLYDTAQAFFDKTFEFAYKVPVWVDNYPKLPEVLWANVFSLTNKIETGKIINYFSSLIVFLYSYYVLGKYFKSKFISSLLITLNPVVISQVSTFCNDGLVYNFFVLALLSIFDTENLKRNFIFIISIVILAGIKLGGLLYAILLLIFAFKKFKNPLKVFSVITAIFLICNINPYATNILRGHNLFYPLAGIEKIDIMTRNTPKQFIGKSMPFKFFWATFSKADNFLNKQNHPIYFKLPFTFTKQEINSKVWNENTRISGFGVLWSGILVLSLFSVFFLKRKKEYYIILGFILLTVLVNPHNWWARYVPQIYLIPLFISLFLNKKVLANILVVLLLINSAIITYSITRFQVLPFYGLCQMGVPVFDGNNFSLYDYEKFKESGFEVRFNVTE